MTYQWKKLLCSAVLLSILIGAPPLAVLAQEETGNLSGSDPRARYEWFAGVAPAGDPRVAVAVVQAHGHLWWKMSAQIAADVFSSLFCEGSRCSEDRVLRYTGDLGAEVAPLMLGE